MLFHPHTSSYLLSQLFVTHLGVALLSCIVKLFQGRSLHEVVNRECHLGLSSEHFSRNPQIQPLLLHLYFFPWLDVKLLFLSHPCFLPPLRILISASLGIAVYLCVLVCVCVCVCVCVYNYTSTGVIFLLQFVSVCVCLCVCVRLCL